MRRPDPVALLLGGSFLAVAILIIAGRIDAIGDARWVWPMVLIAVGSILLVAMLGGRRHHEPPASGPE